MNYEKHKTSASPEILWNDEYVGAAITLNSEAFVSGICKAGTPIDNAGRVANDENAFGVLLTDVYMDRPQGTVIVGGYVDRVTAQNHSGYILSNAARAAIKDVILMPEGGV